MRSNISLFRLPCLLLCAQLSSTIMNVCYPKEKKDLAEMKCGEPVPKFLGVLFELRP